MPNRRRSSAAARAQARARAKQRALERLRLGLDVESWPLDGSARNVVELHWARYIGREVYRAHFTNSRSRRRRRTRRRLA